MNRFLTVTVLAALLCAWVGAQGSRVPSAAEQAELLKRNRTLYRAAVEGGLNLTDVDHQKQPLYRAKCFTQLATEWAKEIDHAARNKDAERVSELGVHLEQLVDEGVVPNLEQARKKIEAGSKAEADLFKQRDEAVNVLKPLEESLQAQGFEAIGHKLAQGRSKVEKATKIEGR